MTINKAIALAWKDAAYKAKLLHDPQSALEDVGLTVPKDAVLKVVENSNRARHIVLPAAPKNAGELSLEELEKVAAGMGATAGGVQGVESWDDL